jgi:hypothetical protein
MTRNRFFIKIFLGIYHWSTEREIESPAQTGRRDLGLYISISCMTDHRRYSVYRLLPWRLLLHSQQPRRRGIFQSFVGRSFIQRENPRSGRICVTDIKFLIEKKENKRGEREREREREQRGEREYPREAGEQKVLRRKYERKQADDMRAKCLRYASCCDV